MSLASAINDIISSLEHRQFPSVLTLENLQFTHKSFDTLLLYSYNKEWLFQQIDQPTGFVNRSAAISVG